jgi:hypothetical protein
MRGEQIGETAFEYEHTGLRRAGVFYPTDFGLKVLPSITAMTPALFDFGDLCRRAGFDVDDPSAENASAAMAAFEGTSEGRRIIAAAQQIAMLEVYDPSGRPVAWESLAITDLDWLAAYARERDPEALEQVDALPPHDPIKFMISLTMKRTGRARMAEVVRARH